MAEGLYWRAGTALAHRKPEGKMAPHSMPLANPFAALSAGRVRSARTVPANVEAETSGTSIEQPGTLSGVRTVPRRKRGPSVAARRKSRIEPALRGLETKRLHLRNV